MCQKIGPLGRKSSKKFKLTESTDCQKRCGLNDIVTLLVTFGSYKIIPNKRSRASESLRVFSSGLAVSKPLRQVIKVIKVIKVKDEHDPESPHSVLAKFKAHHGFDISRILQVWLITVPTLRTEKGTEEIPRELKRLTLHSQIYSTPFVTKVSKGEFHILFCVFLSCQPLSFLIHFVGKAMHVLMKDLLTLKCYSLQNITLHFSHGVLIMGMFLQMAAEPSNIRFLPWTNSMLISVCFSSQDSKPS